MMKLTYKRKADKLIMQSVSFNIAFESYNLAAKALKNLFHLGHKSSCFKLLITYSNYAKPDQTFNKLWSFSIHVMPNFATFSIAHYENH